MIVGKLMWFTYCSSARKRLFLYDVNTRYGVSIGWNVSEVICTVVVAVIVVGINAVVGNRVSVVVRGCVVVL